MAKSDEIYIYSTLTSSQDYAIYETVPNSTPVLVRTIHIDGGANVANKQLYTPYGARTLVSAEDLEFLQKNFDFQLHIKNGFITIDKVKKDVEVAVLDMQDKDKSAPLTPETDSSLKQEI